MPSSAESLLEQVRDILEGFVYESEDPVKRALRRMSDAYNRGGAKELITRTRTRIQATKDLGKLQGITQAVHRALDNDLFDLSPADEKAFLFLVKNVKAKV